MEASWEAVGPEDAEELSRFAYPIWVEIYSPLVDGGRERVDQFYPDWMGPESVRKHMEEGYRFCYAVYRGERAGYSAVKAEGDVLDISKFYFLREFRGFGLASWAMERILGYGRDRGCSRAELVVNPFNEHAIRFYRKHGFAETGRLPENTEGQRPAYLLVMGRSLRCLYAAGAEMQRVMRHNGAGSPLAPPFPSFPRVFRA